MPTISTSVNAVAALLRTRTRDDLGVELGEFSDATRPTEDEVASLLAEATKRVVSVIGTADPCEQDLADDAASVIHQRTAMMVELSYFPEQVNTNRSPYQQIKDLYDADLRSLAEAVAERCGTGTGAEGVDGQQPLFYYGEPEDVARRVSW